MQYYQHTSTQSAVQPSSKQGVTDVAAQHLTAFYNGDAGKSVFYLLTCSSP